MFLISKEELPEKFASFFQDKILKLHSSLSSTRDGFRKKPDRVPTIIYIYRLYGFEYSLIFYLRTFCKVFNFKY